MNEKEGHRTPLDPPLPSGRQILVVVILVTLSSIAIAVFRPFWLSPWGLPVFIVISSLCIGIVAGSGRGVAPFSISFGLACGGAMGLVMAVAVYGNIYAAMAVMAGLLWLAIKTSFVDRRAAQLRDEDDA